MIFCVYIALAQNESCNAMNAYVQVTSPIDFSSPTILSAQALFSPYDYYVESTELVQLTNEDNVCSGNLITDVTNKVVLIMPVNGNCSYVKRIYGAEINGAKAVLLGNDDEESGTVTPIINDKPTDNDGNVISTSIPARMIPYNSGSHLSLELEMDNNPSCM